MAKSVVELRMRFFNDHPGWQKKKMVAENNQTITSHSQSIFCTTFYHHNYQFTYIFAPYINFLLNLVHIAQFSYAVATGLKYDQIENELYLEEKKIIQ